MLLDELEHAKGRKGSETMHGVMYDVSDEDDEAEHGLSNDSDGGEEERNAGLASDATWARR